MNEVCHVAGLVLNALAIIGMTRCKTEFSRSFAVDPHFIQSARGDIQPRLDDIRSRKRFFETIYGITLFLVYAVITAYPFCSKIGSVP